MTLFGWLGTKFNIPLSQDETVIESIPTENCDCLDGYAIEGGDRKRCTNCDFWELKVL